MSVRENPVTCEAVYKTEWCGMSDCENPVTCEAVYKTVSGVVCLSARIQ